MFAKLTEEGSYYSIHLDLSANHLSSIVRLMAGSTVESSGTAVDAAPCKPTYGTLVDRRSSKREGEGEGEGEVDLLSNLVDPPPFYVNGLYWGTLQVSTSN